MFLRNLFEGFLKCFKNVDEILNVETLTRNENLDSIESIRFEKVCFEYEPKSPVLSDHDV